MSTDEASIREENENYNANEAANADTQEQDMATATESTEETANENTEAAAKMDPEVAFAQGNYEQVPDDEFRDFVKAQNDEAGLTHHDPGYIKYGQNVDRDELIEALRERDKRMEFLGKRGPGIRSHEGGTLKADQLKRHPLNPRHDADYIDPKFQDMIESEGGIGDAVVVTTEAQEETEDGRPVHYILSGNRRSANLLEVLKDWDIEPSEYDVNVVFRDEGEDVPDKSAKEMDEFRFLMNSNESSWDMSVVDKFKAMRFMEERGAKQQVIADEFECSVPYVSNVLKLRLVPQQVRDLVHFGHNDERFAEQGVDMLTDKGIPHHVNDDGDIEVHGIPWKNALNMAKRMSKYAKAHDVSEKEAVKKVGDFIKNGKPKWSYRQDSGEGVLRAAQILSQGKFKSWFKDATIEAGLFPTAAKSSASSSDRQRLETEPETGDDEGSTEPAGTTDSEVELTDEETGESTTVDFMEVANQIEIGGLFLTPGWEDKLVDGIRMEDARVKGFVKWLLDEGALASE